VVVPVPRHRERHVSVDMTRAALLSKPLAKRLGLPHRAVLLMRTRARPDKQCSVSRNAGSLFVAFLPHVQAAKLTIYASYW
jgi:predicted amidophosphoribosyltransferase